MSDLKDALMDVKGIGDAKADAILEVLDEHKDSEDSSTELNQGYLNKAITAAQAENYHTAGVYLNRATPDE